VVFGFRGDFFLSRFCFFLASWGRAFFWDGVAGLGLLFFQCTVESCWNKRQFDEMEVFEVVIVGCNCVKKQTTDEKKLAKYTPYPCTSRAA
jgi:hypothetical protein